MKGFEIEYSLVGSFERWIGIPTCCAYVGDTLKRVAACQPTFIRHYLRYIMQHLSHSLLWQQRPNKQVAS
jgi:hypothetical protein